MLFFLYKIKKNGHSLQNNDHSLLMCAFSLKILYNKTINKVTNIKQQKEINK